MAITVSPALLIARLAHYGRLCGSDRYANAIAYAVADALAASTGGGGGGGSTNADDLTSGRVALARGGTHADLSATGGVGMVLKQASAGADITVGTLSASDVGAASLSHAHVATDITSGTLADARIPAGIARLAGAAFTGQVSVTIPAPATVGVWVRAASLQAANMQEWQDVWGAPLAWVSGAGNLYGQDVTAQGALSGANLTLDGNINVISNGNQIGDAVTPWYALYLTDWVAFENSGHELKLVSSTLTGARTIALPDASGTVPLLESANTFTGLPQTVRHDAIGNTLIPTGDLVLVNTTAAGPGPGLAGYSQQQNSPGLFFLAEQWNGAASAQGGAALHFKPIPGAGSTGILQVSSKSYSTGNWERMFDFPSLGPFGFQEGVNYYAFRHKGINNFELGLYIQKLDGLTAGLAVGRDAGTNSTYVRSLAAALPIYMQDSAGAATQVRAASFSGSGAPLTDLPSR